MNGDFDPPSLAVRIDDDAFFLSTNLNPSKKDDNDNTDNNTDNTDDDNENKCNDKESSQKTSISASTFPLHWRDVNNEAPCFRPWMVSELLNISSIKQWAMEWPGSDSSVKPCNQTIGTSSAGIHRWNCWISERKGMIYYAKRRYVHLLCV